jgi:hypothetical protein
MMNEIHLRNVVRSLIAEAGHFDKSVLGDVRGKTSLVFGPSAKRFLMSKGISEEEYQIIADRLGNMSVSDFEKYDRDFSSAGHKFKVKPSTLKAMAIEETTLGKMTSHSTQGVTAAGIIQITKPTIDTLNANLPAGVHYRYETLVSEPSKSIEIAAHYISHFLIKKRGLKDRSAMLSAYKTGPDSSNYVKRVNAFKKFVDLVGGI